MDKMFSVVIAVCICVMLICLAMLPFALKRERLCREQGGVDVYGTCLKVDTVKVVQ
jgi:hypothetical protein